MSDFNWRSWLNQEKTFSLFFHQNRFIVFKKGWLKKRILSYSATSLFFTDKYSIVNFDRILPLHNTSRFWGNFDVIFEFLESQNISSRIFKTRSYFKQKLSKKLSYLAARQPYHRPKICHFWKCHKLWTAWVFISLWYLPLVKISWGKVDMPWII